MSSLYLLPSFLSETSETDVLSASIVEKCSHLKYFIVENIRTARRFLKKINPEINIDNLIFYEIHKHQTSKLKNSFISPLLSGNDMGILSEAGCPGIADPGAEIVALAHKNKIRVIALVGPSSILLAIMASGMNGQNFSFSGYLPIKKQERRKKILVLEKKANIENQSQVFMETPYRNNQLLSDLLSILNPNTYLCIASNITSKDEFISTRPVYEWKNNLPDLNKIPTIFIIGKPVVC